MPGANDKVLRLHLHEGVVWQGNDKVLVENTGLSVSAYILTEAVRSCRVVRVVASQQNWPLVESLYKAHLIVGLPAAIPVQVGSPHGLEHLDPRQVLETMWLSGVDPSSQRMHWATLNDKDFISMALIGSQQEDEVTDKLLHVVKYHPAIPAITFIPRFNLRVACRLLAMIGDPRWFIHPNKPGRLSRLNAFLGLTPENMRALSRLTPPSGRYGDRASLVTDLWLSTPASGKTNKMANEFISRTMRSASSHCRGLLAANKKLVRFICEFWLAGRSNDPEVYFDYKRFFVTKSEESAFRQHVSRCKTALIDTADTKQ